MIKDTKKCKRIFWMTALFSGALLCTVSACNSKSDTEHTQPTTIGVDVDDALITAKIKAELLKDDQIKSLKISVATVNGRVTLNGFVDDPYQIALSTNLAMSVDGVKSINNNLVVKSGAGKDGKPDMKNPNPRP